jgi:hypothetical protein
MKFTLGKCLIFDTGTRIMRNISVLTIAIGIAMVLVSTTGFAMAAITTTGSMSETNSVVWTISSDAIDGVLVPGERQSTTVYGDTTQAVGGTSSYTKSFGFDTKGMSQGQYNVDSTKMFTFDGTGNGNGNGMATSDEYIGLDTMGVPDSTSSWPAFHNTVNAGSSFDLTKGSVVTRAQTRTVTDYPGAAPVALNYGIHVQGLNNEPAVGSASAFMNGHLEEGRGTTIAKASDLGFSNQASVSGIIYNFDQTMTYESGINR